MKQKYTFIPKAIIFCLMLLSIQGLTLKQDHLQAKHDLIKKFAQKTSHKLGQIFHIEDRQDDIDNQLGADFLQQFMAFIFTDKEISDSIFKEKPLSKQAVDRIKNFLLANKSFNDLLLQLLDEDPKAPKCYISMDEAKKRKIITTIIQQYDLNDLMESESVEKSKQDQIDKIKQKISNNPDLGPSVLECLQKNPNFLLFFY